MRQKLKNSPSSAMLKKNSERSRQVNNCSASLKELTPKSYKSKQIGGSTPLGLKARSPYNQKQNRAVGLISKNKETSEAQGNGRKSFEEIEFAASKIEPIDQLLSDIEQSDLSIISHIDAKDLAKKPYNKWDILFDND